MRSLKAKMPVTHLQTDWLKTPLVTHVVEALGAENIRFVGGAVRDCLIGRPVKDIDAATPYHPTVTKEKLENAGLKVVPTGLQHGTVTAVGYGTSIEITTLRRDVETDGRHAVVAFTKDWAEDAQRRDFTMNALYLSPDGALFDPFGGQQDLKAGCVRFIGAPSDRILEDALRIMRFFRFHAHYGKGALDAAGLDAATRHAPMLERLSVERVRDELLKLLVAPAPSACVAAMTEAGIWPHTPVGKADEGMLAHVVEASAQYGIGADALARLAAVVGETGADIGKRLKLSKSDQRKLAESCLGLQLRVPGNAAAMRSLIYQFGRRAGEMTVLMAEDDIAREKLDVVRAWDVPEFPLQGRDLLARGLTPGPEISAELSRLERLWRESDFMLSRDQLLARLDGSL